MTNSEYPTIKQFLVLLIIVGLTFGSFFFIVGTLPQLFGVKLVPIYYSLISLISNFLWVPILLYINKKSNLGWGLRFKLPQIRIFFILILIVVCLHIIITPIGSITDFIHNISMGRIMIFKLSDVDLSVIIIIQIIDFVVLVPIFEEVFFRKNILTLLLKKITPFYAILVSSLLFTLFHFNLEGSVKIFIWGVILGGFYYKTKSIEVAVILHSINNLTSFITKTDYIDVSNSAMIFTTILVSTSLTLFFLIKKIIKSFSSSKSAISDQ
jgi:membrane protease YdiL (CAAX protease family)